MTEFTEGENWEIYPDEQPWAIENINRNECAVAYFHGQTVLYIPKKWFLKLEPNAEQKIVSFATQVYTENDAREFLSTAKCKKSFQIELPPQTDGPEKQYQPVGKVSNLIELIRESTVNK